MFCRHAMPHRFVTLMLAAGVPLAFLACSGGGGATPATPAPVAVAPTVTQQPQDRVVLVGDAATFSVQATGQPQPTFQWRKDGALLVGLVGPQMSLNGVKLTDEGVYDVMVSNTAGSALSTPAMLTVQQKPAFTRQPASLTVQAPQPAQFGVTVVGKPAPTLQWQSSTGASWYDLEGEKGTTLTLASTSSSQSGTLYRCLATSSVGTAASDPAILTVNGVQPWNLTVNLGEGVQGSPAGSGRYPKDFTVQYSYNLQAGFKDLVVNLDGHSAPSSGLLTMDGDHTLTLSATPITYIVSFAAGKGGHINGEASQVVREGQSTREVAAEPEAGATFVNWTGPGFTTSKDNPLVVTNVHQAYTLTANFTTDPQPPPQAWMVTFSAGTGGSLTGNVAQSVTSGGSTTAVTAVATSGYTFASWTGSNGFTSTANPLTLTNVTANQALTANFMKNPAQTYTVTFAAGTGGSVSGNANQSVTSGGSTTAVTAVATSGYTFASWTGSNGFTSTANPLTLTNVTANQAVTANFTKNPASTYTVTFAAGTGGTLSGNAAQSVTSGGSTTAVTAVATSGYTFASWTGSNGFTSTANPLTLTNVTANQALTANFTKNPAQTYTVTFAAGTGGSVSGNANQSVTSGGSTTAVTAVATSGYTFASWTGATASPARRTR